MRQKLIKDMARAGSVCAVEERSHLKEDIKKPVLPFARLLSVSHHIHFLFTRSF